MNRRGFLRSMLGLPVLAATAKSYFFFGGIYRPAEPKFVFSQNILYRNVPCLNCNCNHAVSIEENHPAVFTDECPVTRIEKLYAQYPKIAQRVPDGLIKNALAYRKAKIEGHPAPIYRSLWSAYA